MVLVLLSGNISGLLLPFPGLSLAHHPRSLQCQSSYLTVLQTHDESLQKPWRDDIRANRTTSRRIQCHPLRSHRCALPVISGTFCPQVPKPCPDSLHTVPWQWSLSLSQWPTCSPAVACWGPFFAVGVDRLVTPVLLQCSPAVAGTIILEDARALYCSPLWAPVRSLVSLELVVRATAGIDHAKVRPSWTSNTAALRILPAAP